MFGHAANRLGAAAGGGRSPSSRRARSPGRPLVSRLAWGRGTHLTSCSHGGATRTAPALAVAPRARPTIFGAKIHGPDPPWRAREYRARGTISSDPVPATSLTGRLYR
ncbi:unnamed protein product, partial [Iphiclides podalirius]